MFVERLNNNVIIKIPVGLVNISEIQNLLDFLRYKEIAKKSKATKKDFEDLINSVKGKRSSK